MFTVPKLGIQITDEAGLLKLIGKTDIDINRLCC